MPGVRFVYTRLNSNTQIKIIRNPKTSKMLKSIEDQKLNIYQYIPVSQLGSCPSHVPLAKHVLILLPVKKYPSLHSYSISFPKLFLNGSFTLPLSIDLGLGHPGPDRNMEV